MMNINYVIGKYWDSEYEQPELAVCAWMFCGSEVQYGTQEEAFEAAREISEQEGEQYRVFQLVDLGSDNTY
jgi:hypothetical protein